MSNSNTPSIKEYAKIDENFIDENDDEEEILLANSPLGQYAAEVGLTDAVTIPPLNDSIGDSSETNEDRSGNCYDDKKSVTNVDLIVRFVVSRVVAANAGSLRHLLDDDDMRLLVLALSENNNNWSLREQIRRWFFATMAVLVLIVAVCYCFVTNNYFVLFATLVVVFLTAIPWLALQLLARWFASLLKCAERCLANQRACLRLARERLQVERGFTLVRVSSTADRNSAGDCNASFSRRSAPALNKAAFESARRLTHSIRRLACNVELGGLASLTNDAEFGEAFNVVLTSKELTTATDGFAPTALASMAALLQMHLSDVVLRLLLAFGGCCRNNHNDHRSLLDLFRAMTDLKRELSAEAGELEIRLELHRRRNVTDIDALLEEFLGSECDGVPVKATLKQDDTFKATPLQAATRSLRLQAEALLVKAVLAERSALTSTTMVDVAELAIEARVYAANAGACCDEIATAVNPPALQSPPSNSAALLTTEVDRRPVLLVSPDTAPAIEDEFLEDLVPAGDGDVDGDGDAADTSTSIGVDEAARRAATRRVLGELDSVIIQRRRLFREREQAARARRGLPPVESDGDSLDNGSSKWVDCDDSNLQTRCRRRIVWHGTLEGDGDGSDGAIAKPPSLLASIGSSPSSFAAAALAARQMRGIQLNEEAFGDDEDAGSENTDS